MAKTNPDISAVVLRLDKASFGFASAKEIRDALPECGQAHLCLLRPRVSLRQLLPQFRRRQIYANPRRSSAFTVFFFYRPFPKGLMEKIGVRYQVFKVGTSRAPYLYSVTTSAQRTGSDPDLPRRSLERHQRGNRSRLRYLRRIAAGVCGQRILYGQSLESCRVRPCRLARVPHRHRKGSRLQDLWRPGPGN